jgi:hypothetical protein
LTGPFCVEHSIAKTVSVEMVAPLSQSSRVRAVSTALRPFEHDLARDRARAQFCVHERPDASTAARHHGALLVQVCNQPERQSQPQFPGGDKGAVT